MRLLLAGLLALGSLLPAVDLKGVTLGEHITGPKVAAKDLDGKVVLYEYWGIHCPPCRANVPHISELAAVADTDRLVVIANQCQETGQTLAVWKECKGTDKPVVIDHGNLPGSNVTGIPHCFLFDHTGKLVFDGGPGQISTEMIRKLVDATPGPLVKGGPYKACAREALALRNATQSIAGTIATLRTRAEKGEGEARSEATTLLAGIQEYAAAQRARIDGARTADPLQAAQVLQKMTTLLRGDELGKPFDALLKELQQDKTFRAEIAAAEMLAQIQVAATRVGLDQGKVLPAKRNEAQQVASSLEQLLRKYPETRAGKEAEKLMGKWKST